MFHNLRFALRTYRRSPGFVLVAVLSLALGIGANTAVFSLFHQVLMRSLPVADPDRLVLFQTEGQDPGWAMADNYETVYSYPMYRELRDRNKVFSGVIARAGGSATVKEPNGSANAHVELVSGNFFEVLGVHAALGRTLLPSDDMHRGGHPVVMLSHGYWTRRFGADPTALNRTILINGNPMTVVGVVEQRFLGVQSGSVPEIYAPIAMKAQITPGWEGFDDVQGRWLNVLARLKPGVSLTSAQAATRVLFKAIRTADQPRFEPMEPRDREEYARRTVTLAPASQGINMLKRFLSTPLVVLMAMVGLVLMIACANLANLLIARAATREKEIAIRGAIGAGRGAILRQLLTESVVLTSVAGLCGALLAGWAVSGMLSLLRRGDDATQWLTATLDWRLFGYTMLVATLAGIIFGCAPLMQAWRVDLVSALKDQSGTTPSASKQRGRKVLVAVQIALALVLLAGAGLFTRTLMNLRNTNPGFQAANVLTFAVEPRLAGYDKTRGAALMDTLRTRLAGLPGVEGVTFAEAGPFMHFGMGTSLHIEGYTGSEEPGASRDEVGANYFRILHIPILTGRDFDERDTAASQQVAIINETLAKKYFPGRNPLGMHIGQDKKMECVIVGISRDILRSSLREKPEPFIYFSHPQTQPPRSYVYVRGYGDLAASARSAIRQIDANLPLTDMETMQARVDESVQVERAIASLAAAFGLLATLLAAVGLYGVVAYSVARRTIEIGVRMAMGATPRDVYGIVLREVGVLVAAGVAVGLPIAYGLGRLVESQLFGVRSHDPLLLAISVTLVTLVALIAAYVPAYRAAHIDPVRALHGE